MFHCRALLRLGRFAEAKRELDAVEALYRTDATSNAGFLWGTAVMRAELLLGQGDAAGAQHILDALFHDIDYPHQTSSWVLRSALPVASRVALAAHDLVQAQAIASSGVQLARAAAIDPAQSADVGRTLVILARAQMAAGNTVAARESLGAAIPSLSGGLGAGHTEVAQARALLADLGPPGNP